VKTAGVARIALGLEARRGSGLLRSATIAAEKPPLRTTGVASGALWKGKGELKPLISIPSPSFQSCCLPSAACVLTNKKAADGLPTAGSLLGLLLISIRFVVSLAWPTTICKAIIGSCVYDLARLWLLSCSFPREGLKNGIATGTMFGPQGCLSI
jgi:hypothetical protein